jgi:hypothetical protein
VSAFHTSAGGTESAVERRGARVPSSSRVGEERRGERLEGLLGRLARRGAWRRPGRMPRRLAHGAREGGMQGAEGSVGEERWGAQDGG